MFITVEDLSFNYPNSKENVLQGIDFNVQQGAIVCILGESGSGKSTILRLLAGLETPKKGLIEIDDQIVVDDNRFVLPENREIGVVFQDYALFPHMTVAENILFGIKNKDQDYKEDKLEEVLNLVDLAETKTSYPHQLSGGQQQRIALARSLAIDPALIVMDEPFSSLDASLQARIRGELESIIKQAGITSIFVSHDKDDALSIADKIIVLKDGQIVQTGSPQEINSNPASAYVAGLFS
ncbi:ABC transporter ATP-binding protein [Halanaerobaculum tunisiense]